jgi:hypothetical protein
MQTFQKTIMVEDSWQHGLAGLNIRGRRTKLFGSFVARLIDKWEWDWDYFELKIVYTAKNAEQDWTMFCCPRCSHLSTTLNNNVEPESGVTTLFNIVDSYEQCGSKTLFNPVFISIASTWAFLRV